jgi:hypothetical protein
MSFDYDATGIEPTSQGQGKLLPKQWFTFEIIEYTTEDGSKTYPMEGYTKEKHYPKVDFLAEVVDEGDYEGQRIFHTVTFMPKDKDGAGMAIHFLKTIGQPFEGKITPDPLAWVGERFQGYAIVDEYQGKKKNKLGEIKAVEFQSPEVAQAAKEDTVPF